MGTLSLQIMVLAAEKHARKGCVCGLFMCVHYTCMCCIVCALWVCCLWLYMFICVLCFWCICDVWFVCVVFVM